MLPFFMIPPLALLLAFQAAQNLDLPKWADWGGFGVLSVYMVYRYEKLVKSTHDEMKVVLDRSAEREGILIAVLKDDMALKGQLVDGIRALMEIRACPFENDGNQPRRRRD